jgi:hypothetical protein
VHAADDASAATGVEAVAAAYDIGAVSSRGHDVLLDVLE